MRTQPPPPFITVEMKEPIDQELLKNTRNWLDRNRVVTADPESISSNSSIRCRLVLNPGETVRDYRQAIELKTEEKPPLVILHTAALRTPGVIHQVYKKRVIKEALRGVLLALEMDPCIFFLCNLYEHEDEAALDRKSTNPCPPCQGKFEEWLKTENLLPQIIRQ